MTHSPTPSPSSRPKVSPVFVPRLSCHLLANYSGLIYIHAQAQMLYKNVTQRPITFVVIEYPNLEGIHKDH